MLNNITVKRLHEASGDASRGPQRRDLPLCDITKASRGYRVGAQIKQNLRDRFGVDHNGYRTFGRPQSVPMQGPYNRNDTGRSCFAPQSSKRSIGKDLVEQNVRMEKRGFHFGIGDGLQLYILDLDSTGANHFHRLSNHVRAFPSRVRRRMQYPQRASDVVVRESGLSINRKTDPVKADEGTAQVVGVSRKSNNEIGCTFESADSAHGRPLDRPQPCSFDRICWIDDHRINRCGPRV